jgi:hypothetical protein
MEGNDHVARGGAVITHEQTGEANKFNITGPIVIGYSRTSFIGVPQFSYKDGELDLNVSGDGITRKDTPLGEIVTVTQENLVPVDGPLRTCTRCAAIAPVVKPRTVSDGTTASRHCRSHTITS